MFTLSILLLLLCKECICTRSWPLSRSSFSFQFAKVCLSTLRIVDRMFNMLNFFFHLLLYTFFSPFISHRMCALLHYAAAVHAPVPSMLIKNLSSVVDRRQSEGSMNEREQWSLFFLYLCSQIDQGSALCSLIRWMGNRNA